MRKLKITALYLLLFVTAFGQELKWNTEFDFFFDNTEFAKSPLAIDQTMAGARLTQEIGWKFDKKHYVYGGVDVMRSLGGHKFIDDIHLLAYYQLKDKNTLFKVGAFHRHDLLDDYSDFFFQDSVAYYKHTMEGIYFKKGDDKQFVKLWLDWTGLQSETERESFFIGASAYKEFGRLFFADLQSYMFHYATTRPNQTDMSVSDNLLGQLSAGVRYSNTKGLNDLLFSAGVLAGFERDRKAMDDYQTPVGLVVRANVDYMGFGMENRLYYGQKRMALYEQYGNALYWGNPFLRSDLYFQNKIYWKLLDTKYVTGQLALRTHVSEGKAFFEQLLTVNVSINNDAPPVRKPTLWERIFPEQKKGKSKKGGVYM